MIQLKKNVEKEKALNQLKYIIKINKLKIYMSIENLKLKNSQYVNKLNEYYEEFNFITNIIQGSIDSFKDNNIDIEDELININIRFINSLNRLEKLIKNKLIKEDLTDLILIKKQIKDINFKQIYLERIKLINEKINLLYKSDIKKWVEYTKFEISFENYLKSTLLPELERGEAMTYDYIDKCIYKLCNNYAHLFINYLKKICIINDDLLQLISQLISQMNKFYEENIENLRNIAIDQVI